MRDNALRYAPIISIAITITMSTQTDTHAASADYLLGERCSPGTSGILRSRLGTHSRDSQH